MSNSSLAFAFDEPSPPAVATAAQIMASELSAGRALSRSDVTRIMTDHFGESDALGRWSVRDAHAALELAQVQYLQVVDQIQLSSPVEEAEQFFCGLDARVPTQSRISAADGRSLLGREVPAHCVPELCRALGLEREQTLSADDIVQTVLSTGRAMEFAGRELLMVKRSLVNGSQRLELTGWSAARLDWYKAQGCFTEIIRYQTRLFVPIEGAASAIARLASSA